MIPFFKDNKIQGTNRDWYPTIARFFKRRKTNVVKEEEMFLVLEESEKDVETNWESLKKKNRLIR